MSTWNCRICPVPVPTIAVKPRVSLLAAVGLPSIKFGEYERNVKRAVQGRLNLVRVQFELKEEEKTNEASAIRRNVSQHPISSRLGPVFHDSGDAKHSGSPVSNGGIRRRV